MSTRERYPTLDSPRAFQTARELHTQLIAHLANPTSPAKLKAEVERQVDEAMEAEGLVPEGAKAKAKPAEAAQAPQGASPAPLATEGEASPSAAPTEAAPTEAAPATERAEGPAAEEGGGEAKREASEEATPLPGHLAAQVQELEAVGQRTRAVAQRAQLEEMARMRRLAQRGGWLGLALLCGLMAHFGLSTIVARMITQVAWGQQVASLAMSLLWGLGLGAFALHVAQKMGLSKLAKRTPDRISSLQALKGIYSTELYGAGPLSPAHQAELDQQLEAAHHTMLENLDPEDHVGSAKGLLAIGGCVLGVLALAIPFTQHQAGGSWPQHVILSLFGLLFVCGLVVALAPKLQPLPPLGEGLMDPTEARLSAEKLQEEHRQREAKRRETERLAADQKAARAAQEAVARQSQLSHEADKKHRAQAATQAKTSQDRLHAYRAEHGRRVASALSKAVHEDLAARLKERDRLYHELQDATEAYEQARGFTRKELAHLQRTRRGQKWLLALLVLLSVLSAVVATYPASLTISELLNLPYQYLGGQRLALAPWLLFIGLALFADFWLVQAYAQRGLAKVGLEVLEQGYQESRLRPQGIRYHLKLNEQFEAVVRHTRFIIGVGGALLLVEFIANVAYLVQNSEANLVLATTMALVPFACFVAMTYPHVILHRKSSLVGEALAWGETLPQGPNLPPPQALPFAEAESQVARAEAAQRGLL